jgi:methyl-accepting chemotaxis protein
MKPTESNQKLGQLTIKRAMLGFGIVATGAVGLLAYNSFNTIEQVKIGGHAYTDIAEGKDLIADILPPPLYPVDAFARAHIIDGDLSRASGSLMESMAIPKSVWK